MKQKLIMLLVLGISIFIFNCNVKAGTVNIGYLASISSQIGTEAVYNLYDGKTCDSSSKLIGKYTVKVYKKSLDAYLNNKNNITFSSTKFSSGYVCIKTLSVPTKYLLPEDKVSKISSSDDKNIIISLENKMVDYKITYEYRDKNDNKFYNLPGIVYKVYGVRCGSVGNGSIVLFSGLTGDDGVISFSSDKEGLCLKTTLPKGFDYDAIADDNLTLSYTHKGKTVTVVQASDPEGSNIAEDYKTYKIGFKNGNNYISDIKYNIYNVSDDGKCTTNLVESRRSESTGLVDVMLKKESICVKVDTTTISPEYKLANENDVERILTVDNNVGEILLANVNDGDTSEKIYTYQLGYANQGEYIVGISYEIFNVNSDGTCGNTSLGQNKSNVGLNFIKLSNSSICIKTDISSINSDYKLLNDDDSTKILTTTNNVVSIDLVKITSDEEETVEYKIAYRLADGDWERFIGGVEYKIYSDITENGTCSGTVLAEGTTNNTDYSIEQVKDSSVCLATISFPIGYELYNDADIYKIMNSDNNIPDMYLKRIEDNENNGSSEPEQPETYSYKIIYRDKDTNNIISDVRFSLYSDFSTDKKCSGTVLASGKSIEGNYTIKSLPNDSVCLKTTDIPEEYKMYNNNLENIQLDSTDYIVTIYLVSANEGTGQIPDDGGNNNDTNTTTGNINFIILDKNNKVVSGVKYKICLDIECKNVKYEGNKITHANIPLGTYYVIVTDVPSKYALPNKVYTSILNKDVVNDDVKIVLEEKVVVPDTFMNASKVFTACGIIGILGGVSLLYLNVKKKKLA